MKQSATQRRFAVRAAGRGGFTVFEVAIASALFALLLTMCVQMLRAAKDQQRATDRRVVALQTVQNVAERVENMPYDKLTTESLSAIQIPSSAATYLKDSHLKVMMVDEVDPAAKRVAIELTWRDHRGIKAAPVRLSIWRYPNGLAN